MRFISFLTEMPGDPGENHIQKRERADRQRNRRATKQRGDANKQALARGPQARGAGGRYAAADPGLEKRAPATGPDTLNLNGKPDQPPNENGLERRAEPTGPDTVNMPMVPDNILQSVKTNRPQALEMITLLGAMYQAKRTNASVEMKVPLMVSQSKFKDSMAELFKAAKDKDLPDLAKMSEEIRKGAQSPGQPAAGMQNAPETPGQTPAGKTMLQKLLNTIKNSVKNLSPQDLQAAQKELDKAKRNAKPNPTANATQQPIGKPVITQG